MSRDPSRRTDARNRSIRVRKLPPNTQEGLLQQFLEKLAPVKRVEVFADRAEAEVEFENAAVSYNPSFFIFYLWLRQSRRRM